MSFFTIFIVVFVHAQTFLSSGKITDDKGVPISGVSILEKGTKNGTAAGSDGSFVFKVKPKASLVFSAVGYKMQEVAASGSMSVSLLLDENSLSEVIVTGVGAATSKKKIAFAVESVTADQLPKGNTGSIDQALVGKVAGAQISSTSGAPGAPVNIVLRGINSINSGTSPLIMVDGVQLGSSNLNTLDLNSIERVEIVQGAASASLYGAQGANGVIQVFTKKGRAGQLSVNFSSNISNNTFLNIGHVHKAYKHGFSVDTDNNVLDASGNIVTFDSANGVFNNTPLFNVLDPTNTMSHSYGKNLIYYDHFKEFMISAPIYNNSVSVSGGKDKLDFNFFASNTRQKSNFKGLGYNDRSNFGSNVGFDLFKGFKFRSTTQLVYTKNTVNGNATVPGQEGLTTINGNQGFLYELLNSKPFVNYDQKTPDGNYIRYYGNAVGVNGSNPNYQSQYTSTLNNTVDVIQSFDASFRVNKFIDLDAKYGLNYEQGDERYTILNQTTNVNSIYTGSYNAIFAPDAGGEIDYFTYKQTFQNFLASANLHFDFANDFNLKIPLQSQTLLQYDYRKTRYSFFGSYATDLPLYTPFNATEGTGFKVVTDYVQPFVTYGFVINEKLDWGNLFGVGGGFRTDYSSAFGAGHSPFTFPNANAYIRPSSFDFWKGSLSKIFPELKIRAAFGKAGIQPGPFDRYNLLGTPLLGSSSAFSFLSNQPNPNLQVIVSQEFEIGADINFKLGSSGNWFKQGYFSPTYWTRKTKGDILSTDAAPSTGVGTIKNNADGMASKGFQFKVGADVVSSRNFSWNFTTLFGHQTSVISYIQGQPIVQISSAGSTNYILKAGEKVGQLFGYLGLHSVAQVNPVTNQPYIDKANQSAYAVASNGWVVDTATKQPFFTSNQYSFGDPNPKFNMSFINEFSVSSFLSFNFQIDWVYGQHLYNQTKEWMYRDAIHGDYDNPITINGETGAWTAFYRGVYAQQSRNGTKNYFYENASYARLRNVSVAFDFVPFLKMKTFKKLQLILSGRNLFTVTKYTGFDPEISSGTVNSAWDRGTDHSTVPNFKTYQVGLNVGF